MGTPRRIVVRRSVAAAALAALFAAGCHPGGEPATPSAPGPYARADIDAIVLGPDDAPDGTAYVDGVSGFQDFQASRATIPSARTWWRTGSRSGIWRCSSRAVTRTAARPSR